MNDGGNLPKVDKKMPMKRCAMRLANLNSVFECCWCNIGAFGKISNCALSEVGTLKPCDQNHYKMRN
jgi:hypothetical protein